MKRKVFVARKQVLDSVIYCLVLFLWGLEVPPAEPAWRVMLWSVVMLITLPLFVVSLVMTVIYYLKLWTRRWDT